MDTTKAITHVSLCAGYGGIDIGLSRAIPSLRTVAFSEIEAFACANLVSKMEAGLLDAAPIWTNLKTFPWSEFRDRVDFLSGGYPCQPFSSAGKRLGTEDPRHLWPYIADGIRAMRPRMCFFENVEGHISLGLREVVGELEEIGYQTTWGVFSAREVGAPHQRKRVFILAYRKSEGLERYDGLQFGCVESRWDASEQKGQAGWGNSGVWRRVSFAADCEGYDEETGELGDICSICGLDYCEECECPGPTQDGMEYTDQDEILYARPKSTDVWPSRPSQLQHEWEPPRVVGNTKHNGSHQCDTEARGTESCGEQGWVQELEGGSASMGDTSMQGSQRRTHGEFRQSDEVKQLKRSNAESGKRNQAQPPLGRAFDGSADWLDDAELFVTCDNRTDELRLLGNGVVPATAERAFRTLLAELIP